MQRMPSMPNVARPNPLHTTFKNPNFPANFINEHNVLDYFCNPDNIFYDMRSCNQIIRMQQIDRPLEECLQTMQGDQYVLYNAKPPLYVILKQKRTINNSDNYVTPLAYYYVINGTVYQSPDAFSLIQSRLLGVVDPLRSAFDTMLRFSRFNVAKGYSWQFDTKPAGEEEEKEEDDEEGRLFSGGAGTSGGSKKKTDDDEAAYTVAKVSAFQEQRTSNIMQLLFDQFPPPSGVAPKESTAAAAAAADAAAASQNAAAAAANPLSGIAAMLPPGDEGKDEQPAMKRGK
ncbi:hypothetical protein PFISCL1PPCAC_320 [Pristionchus fissidentatus]|uniref:Mediator of RNA polymerase II transcription subunit 6 n=1 Tax=Pristionchus fissidentatus TaxID=1538716 RepID=A0AAV5US76_9BILA|nr:hypothetical protein PFISCL1PPCAC_320 [Pristionchus fissidentatus]